MTEANPASALVSIALQQFGDAVAVSDVRPLLLGAARQSNKGKRIHPKPAWMKLAIPDEAAKAIKGPADKADATYLLVRIPRAVTDEIKRRSESRIVAPGSPLIT